LEGIEKTGGQENHPPSPSMKRDEIYSIRLEPVEGQEIGKTRPGVIV
jgi:hypothetical protein